MALTGLPLFLHLTWGSVLCHCEYHGDGNRLLGEALAEFPVLNRPQTPPGPRMEPLARGEEWGGALDVHLHCWRDEGQMSDMETWGWG